MSKPDKRQKASDVFNQTNFVFADKVSFDEAFPEIEDVVVEVKEPGNILRRESKGIHRKPYLGEYIDCSNPLCHNGGFSIGTILREMVRDRQTELETYKICQGAEGSRKGRRKYRDCMNFLEIRVSIKYREVPTEDGGE